MKKVKKSIALMMLMILVMSLFSACKSGNNGKNGTSSVNSQSTPMAEEPKDPYFKDFKPVLRFSVASDVHIHDSNSSLEEQRLKEMFEIAYKYADESKTYNKLDAAIIAGDHVDKGTLSSMQKFRQIWNENIRSDTKTLIALGNHEFYTSPETVYNRYEQAHGVPVNEHIEINGFHFIKLSPTGNGWNFDHTAVDWLEEQLEAAAAADPTGTKPIFVIQHQHIANTVYGSSFGWGVTELTSVLSKYPQVVDFSGHSHYPIQNPLSIWQGEFTAVGTGTLSYMGFQINGLTQNTGVDLYTKGQDSFTGEWTTSYDGKRDSAQFLIVEVDANGAVVIIAYDMLADREIRRYYIKTPSVPESFEYTNDRISKSELPVFAKGTEISVKNVTHNKASISFKQATCSDIVESYRIEVRKGNELVSKIHLTSCYFYTPMPETMSTDISGLAMDTEYEVLVYPVNAYGRDGECIKTKIKTSKIDLKPSDKAPVADVFRAEIDSQGIKNGLTNTYLTKLGSATTVKDNELNRYVGDFDANGSFAYTEFKNHYSKLSRSLTFETYMKLDSFHSNYCNPFSNQQTGGVGFEIDNQGLLQFYVNVNGNYKCAAGIKAEKGKYYHLVGTYDGNTVKIYINGVLSGECSASGSVSWPSIDKACYLAIGSDSGPDGSTESPIDGRVAIANIYSNVLDASQVYKLYLDIKD